MDRHLWLVEFPHASPEVLAHAGQWQWSRLLAGGWVFAFLTFLLVLPSAYATFPLLAAATLLPLAVWAWAHGDIPLELDREDGLLLMALAAYGGLWWLDVWRSGHWPVGRGSEGVLLPLWPLLACLLLVALRTFTPGPRLLWLAVSCGALGAGSIAMHERLVLGKARASNGMNAIPFGNLSLLLGGLALLGALWLIRHRDYRRPLLLAGAMLAGVAGMLGSLLSGTRGGWMAAPLMLLLVYRAARPLVPPRTLNAIAATLVGLLLAVALLPQSGVVDRLQKAVVNAQQYWQEDSRRGSIGARLEMWRAGVALFAERPLVGWGEERLQRQRDQWVEAGSFHPGIARYDQLHSDIIDTAARRGSLGLATLLLLYGAPFVLFWRRLNAAHVDPGVRVLGAAGVMVVVAFIDFGLTQSMLRDARGLSGYLGLCVVCWAVLRRYEGLCRAAAQPGVPPA